jgi:DNA-nicking Smr family endonuclease
MRRPRHLSAEERALWDQVAQRTRPLDANIRSERPSAAKPVPVRKASAPLMPFRLGEKADIHRPHDLLASLANRLDAAPVNMDARAFGKLRRGKLRPEGRIDLHGLTLAQAHPRLTSFILSAHAANKRLVLVITGKGKPQDDFGHQAARPGVLRQQVPQWLAMAPLAQSVLQITPAHVSHGGQGAYYVYLRRQR